VRPERGTTRSTIESCRACLASTCRLTRGTLPRAQKKQVKDTIESIRVDDVVREDVLYLKMDIEGHEPEGFRGLSELLRRHQVDFILWEHTPHYYSTLDKETPPAAILRDLGYWVSELHHGGSGNYIAAHPKANAALRRRIMEKDYPLHLTKVPTLAPEV